MSTVLRRLMVIGACTVTVAGLGVPVSAADPDWEVTFEAGQVCTFPLVVGGSGEGSQVYKEFYDKDENLRTLSAGTGFELTYTNRDSGASFTSPSNGAVASARYSADGSSIQVLTGHNAVFMFPTDVPGPSATLYTGRVVISIDPGGIWTVVQESGTKLDICAQAAVRASREQRQPLRHALGRTTTVAGG